MSTISGTDTPEPTQISGEKFYSPVTQIGSRDKSVGWYEKTFSGSPSDSRKLLEAYSGIPADEIDAYAIAIRDKAWDVYPYPCIGQFRFLNLTLYKQQAYKSMLAALKSGEVNYLDVGFFADGAPSKSIYGVEFHGGFIDLSYDLWRDRDTLRAQLMQGDILDLGESLSDLLGKMSYIHLGMVLHVFDLRKQALLLENCIKLLNPDRPGAMILGEAVGDVEGLQTPSGFYMHSNKTLKDLCAEVSVHAGRSLDCHVTLDMGMSMPDAQKTWGAVRARRLVFEIRI
ncbi:putative Methyltransferase [Seiridium cardinale]